MRAVNWLAPAPVEEQRCMVKLRAREAPQPATIREAADERLSVRLEQAALAAPGQACVFYDGTRVLGGGWIASEPQAEADGAPG